MDINAKGTSLQSQLQAQLGSSQQRNTIQSGSPANQPPLRRGSQSSTLQPPVHQPRVDQTIGDKKRLPSTIAPRTPAPSQRLSTSQELTVAKQKVQSLSLREAPLGRLSANANAQAYQPLGQIIDIRV